MSVGISPCELLQLMTGERDVDDGRVACPGYCNSMTDLRPVCTHKDASARFVRHCPSVTCQPISFDTYYPAVANTEASSALVDSTRESVQLSIRSFTLTATPVAA
jgi:hypothetical protein